ncbi:MAG: protein-disulfide reductase DsbD family protein [Candidatus Cryptobacteroides sp.]
MRTISKILISAYALLWGALAVYGQAPDHTVNWDIRAEQRNDGTVEVIFEGTPLEGWHTYSITDKTDGNTISFEDNAGLTAVGELAEKAEVTLEDGKNVIYDRFTISQIFRLNADSAVLKGEISWKSCKGHDCASPEYQDFELEIKRPENVAEEAPVATAAISGDDSGESGTSIWGLILEAILWGFAMLLTPCVFPMVPMTISFFMKSSSTPAAGRFKASMYGLFIVLLYTLPISVIIGLTWIFGGETVTADIFNWLSTHWLPNIIFFIVFMVFAASFFGAFEITLPSSLVNKSDRNSDKGGLAGIFFMALTLVLVSFSCTGPIVGSVLIKSTQGEFWTPMVTMLAFSVSFALPFTIFAMFPSLLKKLKSGSWLNSVKVVLGFIEVALGFKFLSVADQTYHWGILDREVYLAIWIVTFTLLGLYLLGKIRFEADDKVEHIGVFRLALVIIDFTFVVYMIPGMFGAPLKALSGYLPPLETQDFIILTGGSEATGGKTIVYQQETSKMIDLPHGLKGYTSVEDALEASKMSGKPVFVDITGHGCVNCREMEQRVWSATEVLNLLGSKFEIVALYTDDKMKLPEDKWVTTETGKVLKDLGRVNSYYVREHFGVNAQPNYTILSPEGEQLVPVRGYNLDVDGFVEFLEAGLNAAANLQDQ